MLKENAEEPTEVKYTDKDNIPHPLYCTNHCTWEDLAIYENAFKVLEQKITNRIYAAIRRCFYLQKYHEYVNKSCTLRLFQNNSKYLDPSCKTDLYM